MKRITRNEIFTAILVVITVFIASCDFSEFAIPTSVTIKGTPEVRVPLGSPFVGENKDIIERYLSADKIMEMMGGASEEGEASPFNTINIYEYEPTGVSEEVKTFVIHYPLARMPYDLGVYMQQIYEIKPPKITGIDLRRPAEIDELFPGTSLSELTALTSGEIETAFDKKIDGWVDDAVDGKQPNADIPAAQTLLDGIASALEEIEKLPLSNSEKEAQRTALIAQTKVDIKGLPQVKEAKSTATSQFTELINNVNNAGGLKQKIEIPLGDMAKLVKYIDVKDTGLKVKETAFYNKIEIAIPQFGIGGVSGGGVVEYNRGAVKDGGLYFTTEPERDAANVDGDPETYRFTLSPDEPNLTVYISIIDFITEGPLDFEPDLEFDWTKASVNPGSIGELTGTYDMDFGNIKDFLGESFELPEALGYLYVHDLPISKSGSADKSTILLEVGANNDWDELTNGAEEMEESSPPTFPVENGGIFTQTLPPASLNPIDMTAIFEAPTGSSLKYTVKMGEIEFAPSVLEGEISADMVVVIPLAFKVKAAQITVDGKSYVPLSLKGEDGKSLLPEIEEDLFGRNGKDGMVDEVIGYISGVSLKLENFINKAIPNAAILIKSGSSEHLLELSSGDDSKHAISFDDNDVTYPFKPEFQILIPCDQGKTNEGTLSIGRGYDFDFNLVVEAKADLNKTIDF
ncbi:MAG: hypothetical protein LBG05_10515 [Treponema sp.]|nr:hypothetical protein [Treponema sp.]